jgi:hypothetical protein
LILIFSFWLPGNRALAHGDPAIVRGKCLITKPFFFLDKEFPDCYSWVKFKQTGWPVFGERDRIEADLGGNEERVDHSC